MGNLKTNIHSFYFVNDSFIFNTGNVLESKNKTLFIGNNSMVFPGNNVAFVKTNSLIKQINISAFTFDQIEIIADDFKICNEGFYIANSIDFQTKKTTIKYCKDNNIIWEKVCDDFCSVDCFDSIVLITLLKSKNHLICFDKSIGRILWEFSVSDLGKYTNWEGEHEGKIDGNIFECQGVLIIRITENQLIGIENQTGKLLWKNQYPQKGFFYGKYNDECYTMHEQFCKLNPLTGKEEPLFPFSNVFKVQGADNYCIQLFTDKYMFTVGRWDLVILQWDKQTGEILWKHELHPKKRKGRSGITVKGDVLEPVQYRNGKLYVLDSTKTLHIFERE